MKSKSPVKATKDSKIPQEISKDCSYLDFLSDNSGRLFPEKDSWRDRLRHTMLLWSEKKDAYEIEQFCIEYKIPRRTLYFWKQKFPDIAQTIEDVKAVLASTRRVGALTRKLDKDVVFKDLHKYDPEWHDVNVYHSKLKEQEQNEKKIVVLESMCSHDDHIEK